MKTKAILVCGLTLLSFFSVMRVNAAPEVDGQLLARGHYLIAISGCNDCHTPGYAQTDGKIAETQWLTGSPVGFQGPWGTTYPSNLRLLMNTLTETQWLQKARSPMRPPMPWFNLKLMSDADLRAIYHYVRHLGPVGEPAPAYASPGQAVITPYFEFVPKNLPVTAHNVK